MNPDLRLPEPSEPPEDAATAALLRGVLHREADAVQPSANGWARIEAELTRRPTPLRRRRPAVAGPLLAAAAALVVVAGAGTVAVRSGQRAQPAAPGGSVALRTLESDDVLHTPTAALPVYVAARQGGRIVLYREFRRVALRPDASAKVEAAVRLAITAKPQDGDYLQLFAPGQAPAVHATVTDDAVTVDISPAPRAAGIDADRDEAVAAVQQIVWTATAAAAVATTPGGAAAARPPRTVHLLLDGRPGRSLFGLLPLDPVIDRTFGGDPRAKAWVIEPAETSAVSVGPLAASGDAAAGRDGTVHVTLSRNGQQVAAQDVPLAPLEGAPGPLRPGQRGAWRVSGWSVPGPGRYVLTVAVTDVDGIRWADTKSFTAR